ncbi:MAG: hypothetical protein ACRERD_20045 [Candidatus Binatia bacterium]
MLTLNDKHHPSDEWIAHLRQRFPVERTVDEALTWKLHAAGTPACSGCLTRGDHRGGGTPEIMKALIARETFGREYSALP